MEEGCRYPQLHDKFKDFSKGLKCSHVVRLVTARCVRNENKKIP